MCDCRFFLHSGSAKLNLWLLNETLKSLLFLTGFPTPKGVSLDPDSKGMGTCYECQGDLSLDKEGASEAFGVS